MWSRLLSVFVSALSVSSVLAGTKLNGVNIAGFDFGCDGLVRISPQYDVFHADQSPQGYCPLHGVTPPLLSSNGRKMDINHYLFFSDGPGQMNHFSEEHGMNVFRLPVGWQFLVGHKVGGPLVPKNIGLYDDLVKACIRTGAYCIIDVHNYGRYDGKIIGQGGPSDEQFASLWRQLASRYRTQNHIIMGLMNEPYNRMQSGAST